MQGFHRREVEIETACMDLAAAREVLYLKLNVWGRKGWPDRLLAFNGKAMFVEFKRPGEDPTPIQAEVHRRLRLQGMDVRVVDNVEDFNAALADLCGKTNRKRGT